MLLSLIRTFRLDDVAHALLPVVFQMMSQTKNHTQSNEIPSMAEKFHPIREKSCYLLI